MYNIHSLYSASSFSKVHFLNRQISSDSVKDSVLSICKSLIDSGSGSFYRIKLFMYCYKLQFLKKIISHIIKKML